MTEALYPYVSAVVVTRGNVDLDETLVSIQAAGIPEILVWDNSRAPFAVDDWISGAVVVGPRAMGGPDLSVYGRYAAIEHASQPFVYVQDDDCVLEPGSITAIIEGLRDGWSASGGLRRDLVSCNMPQAWRDQPFYRDHALVGFGAAFHRDLPAQAFDRYYRTNRVDFDRQLGGISSVGAEFARCCDVVFTALTPRILVDVPYENLPYATDPDRMYRQPTHVGERKRFLKLALEVLNG